MGIVQNFHSFELLV